MDDELDLDQILELLEHSLSGHDWSCYVADDDRTELTADTHQSTSSLRRIRSTSVSVSVELGDLKVDLASSDCTPAGLARMLGRVGWSVPPSASPTHQAPVASDASDTDIVAVLSDAASAFTDGLGAGDARLLLSRRRRAFSVRTPGGKVFSASGERFNQIAALALERSPIRFYEVASGTPEILSAERIDQSLERLGRATGRGSHTPRRDSAVVLSPFAAAQLLNAIGDAALRAQRDPEATDSTAHYVVDRLGPDPLRSSLDESGSGEELLGVWPPTGSGARPGRLWRGEIDALPDRTWFGLGVPEQAPSDLPDEMTLVVGFESLQQAVNSPFVPVEVRALVSAGPPDAQPAVQRVLISLDEAARSVRPAGSPQLMVLRHTTWVGPLAVDGDVIRPIDH